MQELSPKLTFRKVVFQKQKAKTSEAKTRFNCVTEAHESTRQKNRVSDEKDS